MVATMQDYAIGKGLPKKTVLFALNAEKSSKPLFSKRRKVHMKKECNDHGKFCNLYWSDVGMYLKAEEYAHDGMGLRNPMGPNLGKDENVHITVDNPRVDMLTYTALAILQW